MKQMGMREAIATFRVREYINNWYAEKLAPIKDVDAATASFLLGQGRLHGKRLIGCQRAKLLEIARAGGYDGTL